MLEADAMINSRLQGGVGVVELDRPERRNAVDAEHCDALREAVEKAVAADARALVITGSGTSFCSGADLGTVYGDDFRTALYAALTSIVDAPVPVIAAVNGPAVGAGTQLAIACDLRVAAEGAVFAVPTARIGLAVDPWTVRRLAAVAGGGTARALLLGCDTLTAEQAHARGLVDRLGDLDAALRWAEEIAAFAPLTLAYSKRAVNGCAGSDVPEADLTDAYDVVWQSEDAAEGHRARAAKRPPRFLGR
jgi:enoyl-CoA hydratase